MVVVIGCCGGDEKRNHHAETSSQTQKIKTKIKLVVSYCKRVYLLLYLIL